MKNLDKKIVLASGSPRRIEMMKAHGFDPIVHPAKVNEELPAGIDMGDAVMFLALKKALAVKEEVAGTDADIVIAADTVVFKDEILGKPEDRDDAARMLKKIRDTVHFVATGVAIADIKAAKTKVFYNTTKVFCSDFSDADLESYLDTDEPYDKAGAYAIQGLFGKYIDHIEGSYDNVVGFPWELIEKELTK